MGVVEVLDPVQPARAGGWKVDVSRGERNGRVSSEWFNRPDDERYLSLDDLWANVKGRSERSRSRVVQTANIRVEAARDNPERLHLMLPKAQEPVAPTHWAFGQLASIVGAPASYLQPEPMLTLTKFGFPIKLNVPHLLQATSCAAISTKQKRSPRRAPGRSSPQRRST